jgi:hypothetical protein
MGKVLFATFVGLAVCAVVYLGFASYTWTAIHSAWSASGIKRFHTATLIVPPAIGILAGWCSYRWWRL